MSRLRYSVVIDWDEMEGVYVATVPALSISTYGDTKDQVMENAREAVIVTVEGLREIGQPIPQHQYWIG
ncbi:MAG: type II toxin-antitoxin system HicB family antitoxin [Dehalococcoidia bacterium]